MNAEFKWLIVVAALIGALTPLAALAQAPPAEAAPAPAVTQPSQSSAQSEAGEPRATTSPDAPPQNAASAGTAAPAPSPASRPAAPRTQRGAATANAVSGNPGGGKAAAADRLELGTATVTGDREQPKVMYIVPWKRSDIGDLSGKPMNSLLDEALAPVDRDEFKRQVIYYQAVQADAAQKGASKPPAQQGEK
jgi:hypothetical protein